MVAVGVVLPAAPAMAANYVACGDVLGPSGLVRSIERGNAYRGGTVVVELTPNCTYVVPEAAWDFDDFGNRIYTDSAFWKLDETTGYDNILVVEGNGATITRDGTAPRFRIFDIGDRGEVVLKNLTISNGATPHGRPDGYQNTAADGQDGGAIQNAGRLTLENVTITGNGTGNGENGDNGGSGDGGSAGAGGRGGGIYNSGTLTITGSSILNNGTGQGGNGGDGFVNGGRAGSGGDGGGIYNTGALSISTSVISGNSTGWAGSAGGGIYGGPPGYRGSGGGIAGGGSVSVDRSLFSSNNVEGTMAAVGGAIAMSQGGNLAVANSTFSTNKAWRGGALYVSNGTAVIRSSTFTGNDATGTGDQITGDVAAMDRGATMSFANTVMEDNDAGQVDCNTAYWTPQVTYSSLGGLLSDENSGCGTNTMIADAKFEALANWGGPTSTRMPKSDSPVLGAGVAAYCLPVDQRGVPRPSSGCDVGAVERVAAPTPGLISGPQVVSVNVANTYTSSATAGGAPLAYLWSVSGAAATIDSATSASPQITFTNPGAVATVRLNVRVAGTSDAESIDVPPLTVRIPPVGNAAPQLEWSGSAITTASEGDVTRFPFSAVDPEGTAVAFAAGFPQCGTGGTVVGSNLQAGAGYVDCSFPNGPTSPKVQVQVEDVWGTTTLIATTVSVAELAPTISVSGSTTASEGAVASYSFSIHEVGSDTFTPVTACSGPGVSKVSGSDFYSSGGHDSSGSFQCRLGNGPSTATATVTANGGSGSTSIAVTNLAPLINVSGPNPAAENGSTNTTHRYELNAVDPGDKANLTVVPGSPSCGGAGVGVVVSFDAMAIVCRFADGPGTAYVSAVLRDQDGATSSGGGLTVQIDNVAPTVTVAQPAGPVTEGSTAYFAVSASDSGRDTLVVTPPAGCTTTLLDTSIPGFISAVLACVYGDGPAVVSRTVTVSDGTSSSSATIANQQVTDSVPSIAAAFTGGDTWEGVAATLRIGSITDPGQDTVTSIVVNWGDGTSESFAWPLTSSDLPHVYPANGEYSATVDLTDEDGTYLDRAAALSMVVHNLPPAVFLTVPESINEGAATTISYTVNLGPTETYSIQTISCGKDGSNQDIPPSNIVQGPAGGTFECLWAMVNRNQQIVLSVQDSGGLSSSAGANVYIINLPVVVEWTSGPRVVFEDPDAVHRFDFRASDYGTFGMTVLTFSMNGGLALMNGCGAGGVLVPGASQSGVVFDETTGDGYIECKFPNGPATTHVQVDISDYQTETVAGIDVTVLNAPPTVTLTAPAIPPAEGQPAVFSYTTSDPAGEPVTPSSIYCGPNATLSSQSLGTFTCLYPDGPVDYTASITVTDGADTGTGSALVHVVDAVPTSIALLGDANFESGAPYELIIGTTTDLGDDTVNTWTIHWGDGSTSVLTSQTPNPTHVYVTADPRTITVDVTNEDGSYAALGTKSLTEFDHVPPVLTVPDDVTMEGNGTDGAYWAWPRSAVDDRDGNRAVECTGPTMYGYDFFYVGTTTYDCWATDTSGNRSDASFTVTVVDTTAPVFHPDVPAQVAATSSSGAIVSWNATATDAVDWRIGGTCDAVSGALFAIGPHSVYCTATDRSGNIGVLDLHFEVGDFTAPAISPPQAQLLVDATGPDGGIAVYPTPTASDAIDGTVAVSCSQGPGTVFPLGHTTVTCSATDAADNASSVDFDVLVRDVGSPVIVEPADILAAPTGADGAIVTYDLPAVSDAVDPDVTVSCAPASGTLFPIGATLVQCESVDDATNRGVASFTITVQDRQSPVVTPPANIVVEATGSLGETVTYTGESATDVVDGTRAVTCSPASGTLFLLGVTTVTCTASDSEDNVGTAIFTVSIVDTTAPIVTAPADLSEEATGSTTIVTFSGAATDGVDGSLTASCAPASGSAFALGDTTVTCSATDASGNSGDATFTVSVVDTTAPTVAQANLMVRATSNSGAVALFSPTATDTVDGTLMSACTPASGTLFPVESTTTVTCSATDLSGNLGSVSFTVSVRGALFAQDAAAGDTEVEVSADIFAPGDYVVIDEGSVDEEVRFIEKLGSIVFAAPLAHAHAAGTMVSVIDPPPLGDTTAPAILVSALGTVVQGSAQTTGAACTDDGVGVEVCDVPLIDTGVLGPHTVTIRSWDFNGNLSTLSLDYTVVAPPAALGATGADNLDLAIRFGLLLLLAGTAVFMIRRRTRRPDWLA